MGKGVNAVIMINAIKWGFSALNPSGVQNGQIGQAAQNAPDELLIALVVNAEEPLTRTNRR